ncbi:hypothetical protein [Dethiosulfovibrio salsuginis]|uniref:Uncharacterized protein n=1 Tax=Dethiosulfovibrio salsuginis TaxID=561720 RepID=A0A1X7IMZ1_9BACT|nr:hypothetical protein [Dethiosulfovibrio salsuginis]SMG16097.1 hypothetical protein SAMN06275492_10392 [Dethiosulfovibrio salsuginis]
MRKKPNPSLSLSTDAIQSILKEFYNFKKIEEEEKTKRTQIIKEAEACIERIRSQKEIFLEYLEHEYKERASTYQKLFSGIDAAIEKGDTAMVNSLMQGVISQIQTSPFRGIQDFREKLMDKNFVDEL